MASLLVGMGTLHFLRPGPFVRIVPRVIGRPRLAVYLSGAAELASGALLLAPRTRRVGGLAAAATMAAVFPANVQMALDAGPPRRPYALGAWLRLPLQVPLVGWALAQSR
ncbi:MAG: DoxX family protein [Acidimicrobiales bacterium]